MKQTVGAQLRSARESKGITLDEVVKATHIREHYLQELENDHPELLNSAAQARGFLRLYASFLGLSPASLIGQWGEQAGEEVSFKTPVKADESGDQGHINKLNAEETVSEGQNELNRGEPIPEEKNLFINLKGIVGRLSKIFSLPVKGKEKADAAVELEDAQIKNVDILQDSPLPSPQNLRSASEVFQDIGLTLRERREVLELSLMDVERFTSVKREYLSAMENGLFEKLPSTIQGRGMLNNYSKFLALDDAWIMDAYAQALQSQRDERMAGQKRRMQPPLTVKLNIPEKWRRFLNPDLIIGGLFILSLFAFIIWGGAQVFSGRDPAPTEAPSISDMLQQSPTPQPIVEEDENGDVSDTEITSIPGVIVIESTPTQIATVNAAPLQLYIIVHDRAFLRVTVDGFEEFNGRVIPGDVYTYSGEDSIELVSGNGAALEVYFNQEYLGNLGSVGEVINLSFSRQGLSTSTPEPTPTPAEVLMPVATEAEEN